MTGLKAKPVIERCGTCNSNLTDCCHQCLVCVDAGRASRKPCGPNEIAKALKEKEARK